MYIKRTKHYLHRVTHITPLIKFVISDVLGVDNKNKNLYTCNSAII